MNIYVDADACPKKIKEILFRAAQRQKISLLLVSNQSLTIPSSAFIRFKRVPMGIDVADQEIQQLVEPGDLVITADIPLADGVIQKGGLALNPRGYLYDENNIKQRLSMRNFMEELRDSGTHTGGPSTLSAKDIREFANALDRILAKYA